MYNMYALESIQSNDFLYYDFKHYQITEQTFFCAVYFSHPVSFVLYVYSPESMHYNQAIFDLIYVSRCFGNIFPRNVNVEQAYWQVGKISVLRRRHVSCSKTIQANSFLN